MARYKKRYNRFAHTYKYCVFCKKEYTPSTRNQKFCSPQCSKTYHKRLYEENLFKGRTGQWLRLRFEVLKRDDFTCQYCGSTVQDGRKIVVDHIVPRKKGGKDEYSNLITACEDCNLGKTDMLLYRRQIEKIRKRIKEM